jgi:cystathionine beta-lyase family protein involved in aluminum resistance
VIGGEPAADTVGQVTEMFTGLFATPMFPATSIKAATSSSAATAGSRI